MVILLMGVTGAGKTRVGLALAESLHWKFVDADDYHPPANVAKMRVGIPLEDADREPWLTALQGAITRWLGTGSNVVFACSALKQSYRQQLLVDPQVKLVYLKGSQKLIAGRLAERHAHYMNPGLLASQFATLEEPKNALTVTVDASVPEIVTRIRAGLGI